MKKKVVDRIMISHEKPTGFDIHKTHIEKHWLHAKEKHPYFCDGLLPTRVPNSMTKEEIDAQIAGNLRFMRKRLMHGAKLGNLMWNEVLNCEVWEAMEALANGDMDSAKEELYDCVAVLLRTIDVLNGMQELGNTKQ